jgi:hypothetical protein
MMLSNVNFFPKKLGVKAIQESVQFSSQGLDKFVDGKQFKKDFHRTSEVILWVKGQEKVHYSVVLAAEAREIRKQFLATLRQVNPQLELAIKKRLHQAGPFFSARQAMEIIIFSRMAISTINSDLIHKIVVNIEDEHQVTVKETASYKSLQLCLPDEHASNISLVNGEYKCSKFSAMQQDILTIKRKAYIETYLPSSSINSDQGDYLITSDSQVFADTGLVSLEKPDLDLSVEKLNFCEKPFVVSVNYKLYYDSKEKDYQLLIPSAEDIFIEVPTTLAEKLIFGNFSNVKIENRNFNTKFKHDVSKLFARFINIIKNTIIGSTTRANEKELPAYKANGNYLGISNTMRR